jgi:death-on-curing protein
MFWNRQQNSTFGLSLQHRVSCVPKLWRRFLGIRDAGLLESAVLRPQNGYYSNVIEEAAALMESLANNHAFIDGNKRVSFVMTDTMLRANGRFWDTDPLGGHKLITGAMEKNGFRFTIIRDWIASIVKALAAEENRARKKK